MASFPWTWSHFLIRANRTFRPWYRGRISNPEGRWPAFLLLSSLIAVISYVM